MLYVCMYIEKRDVGILNFAAPCSIITAHFSEQHCSMSLAKNLVYIYYLPPVEKNTGRKKFVYEEIPKKSSNSVSRTFFVELFLAFKNNHRYSQPYSRQYYPDGRYPKIKLCIFVLILDNYEQISATYVTMQWMI